MAFHKVGVGKVKQFFARPTIVYPYTGSPLPNNLTLSYILLVAWALDKQSLTRE